MTPYKVQIRGKLVEDDGFREERPAGWDANQFGVCPDCGGTWVWWEAGYVPGTRQCMGKPVGEDLHGCAFYHEGCGSMFSVQTGERWFLRRERFY